jgi:hypothetical protein
VTIGESFLDQTVDEILDLDGDLDGAAPSEIHRWRRTWTGTKLEIRRFRLFGSLGCLHVVDWRDAAFIGIQTQMTS